jgi:hypothetical protein
MLTAAYAYMDVFRLKSLPAATGPHFIGFVVVVILGTVINA